MSHQYATLEDTVYLYFGANDTAGSGNDGATPVFDVRLGGAAAGAAPVLSGSATLLTHANYPAGAHEVAIAATAANGFAANNTYGVFCTLLVDSQNPTGFVGSFRLAPVPANATQISGDATAADNLELATENAVAGYLAADLTHIHGTALTETAGQLAGRFVNFFDQAAATFSVATALADFKATGFSTHSAADVVTALGTGATLTAIPWNSTWDAEVESECNDALVALNLDHLVSTATGIPAVPAGTYLDQIMDDGTAVFDRTTDSLQAIRDRGDAGWITATGFSTLDAAGVRAAMGLAAANLDTQIGDVPTVSEFNARTLLAASYATSAVCTEARLAELDAANLPTDVANVKTDTTAILVDTNELQTNQGNWLTATGFALASVCTEARLAELDAANLPTDVANVKTDTAAILLDTGTDGVVVVTLKDGAIGADVVADIFSTTTLTEAYAADGAAATPAQLLYLISEALTEFAISSTTLTVKKLDGSTTAATYTLDSATAPTSRTRAS